jgi:glycosyltransferase involved in cell wall biosynthesis
MKVTVITPTLGLRTEGLIRAVRSVNEQQGDFEVEHILVCPSKTVLPDLPQSEGIRRLVKYLDTPGIYQAMNYGVSQVSGEYFVFLGDDDYLLPNSLESRLSVISSKSYDFVYSDSLYENSGLAIVKLETTSDPFADWYLDLLKFQHASVIFRSTCQQKFGDYEYTLWGFDLKICSDYLWFGRCFNEKANVGYLALETVVIGGGGVSSSRIIRTFLEGFLIAVIVSKGGSKIRSFLSWGKQGMYRSLYWVGRKVKNEI